MAEISLHAYLDYLEDRLSRDAYSEVVAHCRHILETYPKHLETYKLLARALAAQDEGQDALDLFQRVLSSDPNDFIAHIGMSDAYRESNALEQAIWHLERAFEQVPNNLDLQEEIKRLYEQRGERAPRKIHLTSGALARMYLKGKLYDQAIAEIRAGIAKDPERLDLQVLLADALWESRQEVNAGKVAAEILKRLPYSLDANRILAQLWMKYNRPVEARPFLEHVGEVDPVLRYRLEHNGQEPSSEAFRLVMLDFRPEQMAAQSGAADWVSQIGAIEKQKGVTGPLEAPRATSITDIFVKPTAEPGGSAATEDMPDWLKSAITGNEASDSTPAAPTQTMPLSSGEEEPDWLKEALGKPGSFAAPTSSETVPQGDEQAPDWLTDAVGGTPAPAPAAAMPSETVPLAGEDAPDWLKDALGGSSQPAASAPAPMGAAPGDTPDWLQEALTGGPAILPERPEPEPAMETPVPSISPMAPDDDVPEWLDEIRSEEKRSAPPTELPTTVEDRDVPSWLNDILRDKPGSTPASAAMAEPDAPSVVSDDWLDSFLAGGPPITTPGGAPEAAAPTPITPTPPPVPEPARSSTAGLETWDDTPVADWLSQGESEEAPAAEAAEGGIPDWLSSAPKVDTAPAAPVASDDDEELPAWLAGAVSATSTEQAKPEPSVEADEALPAWLNANVPSTPAAAAPQPAAEAESDELPDWLLGSPEVRSGLGEKPAPQVEEEAAVPDWLSSAPKEEAVPAAPAAADEDAELPDWLAGAGKDEEEEAALPDWFSSTAPQMPAPAPAAAIDDDGGLPDWLSGGEKEEQGEGEPDWLANLSIGTPAQAEVEPASDEALPDWMSQSQPEAQAEAEEDDWLARLDVGKPAAEIPERIEADVPDWMSEIEDAPAASEAAPAQASEPDWMAEFEMSAPATAEPQPAESDMPDWMSDDEEEPEAEAEGITASEPDWMSRFEEQPEVESASEPEPASVSLPSWLDEEDEDEDEPQPAEPEAKPQPAQTDWLSSAIAPTRALPYMETLPGDDDYAPPPKEVFIDSETPDWLSMLGGQDDAAAPAAQEQQEEPEEAIGGDMQPEPETPALPASEEETQVLADDQPMSDDGADIPSWLTDGDLDSEDAVKWLEGIAAKYDPNYGKEGEETPAAEATPQPATAEASTDEDDEAKPSWLSDEPAATPEPAVATQDGSDDALPSWLRSDDEGEELPSWLRSDDEEVTTPAATPMASALDNGSEELAWLDEQVTAQGVNPSGVVSQELTPDHPPVATSPIPPPDATAEPVSDDDLPEWLRGEDIEVEMEKAGTALSSEYGDLPDLDVEDEELAWLDSALKAEEGTTDVDVNFEELLAGTDDDEKLPSWLAEDDEEEKAPEAPAPVMASEPEPVAAAESEDEGLPDWLSDMEPEGTAEVESAVTMTQAEPEPPAPEPEPVHMEAPAPTPADEDTLPAWLSGAGESADTGLDEFLKAAVPAASKEPAEAPQAPAAPAPPKPAPLPVTGPLAPPPVAAAPSMPAPAAAAPSGAGLNDARTKMTDGYPADALNMYEDIVASGQSLDETIMDLNEYVKGRRVDPRAFRIMGDAMMAQGRLQDALDMYRKALDQY